MDRNILDEIEVNDQVLKDGKVREEAKNGRSAIKFSLLKKVANVRAWFFKLLEKSYNRKLAAYNDRIIEQGNVAAYSAEEIGARNKKKAIIRAEKLRTKVRYTKRKLQDIEEAKGRAIKIAASGFYNIKDGYSAGVETVDADLDIGKEGSMSAADEPSSLNLKDDINPKTIQDLVNVNIKAAIDSSNQQDVKKEEAMEVQEPLSFSSTQERTVIPGIPPERSDYTYNTINENTFENISRESENLDDVDSKSETLFNESDDDMSYEISGSDSYGLDTTSNHEYSSNDSEGYSDVGKAAETGAYATDRSSVSIDPKIYDLRRTINNMRDQLKKETEDKDKAEKSIDKAKENIAGVSQYAIEKFEQEKANLGKKIACVKHETKSFNETADSINKKAASLRQMVDNLVGYDEKAGNQYSEEKGKTR